MKPEQITLYRVRMPLISPFETSFGRITHRECIMVAIRAGGVTGWGECVADRDPGYAYETTGTAWHVLQDFVIPLIMGSEIEEPAQFHTLTKSIRGHAMAKGGVEMAYWDWFGKTSNRSLAAMLGVTRQKVAVGVSVGLQNTPQELVQVVENYLNEGYGRIKIKIKPGRDIGDTTAVRQAFRSVLLQVDANSSYTLETVIPLEALDALDLLLIEQPLAEDDLWDHSKLRGMFKTPICLDESILTARHARQAIEMGACQIINIKAGRVGGLSEAILIHDLCYSKGIPVWCGGMLETGLGRAANLAMAALPGFLLPGDISATDRYYREDITNEVFVLNHDSTITVPDGPGLGVTINQKSLEKYTLQKKGYS